MRDMSPIKQEFAGKDVEFLTVNVFEEQSTWRKFVAGSDLEMTWLWGGDEAARTFGVKGVPAVVVLDGNQKVIWRSSLRSAFNEVREVREALLEATNP